MFKMKLVAQIKFNSDKQKIVKFGEFRYLIYLTIQKDEQGAMNYFLNLMSKELGVPPARIRCIGRQGENYVFEVD